MSYETCYVDQWDFTIAQKSDLGFKHTIWSQILYVMNGTDQLDVGWKDGAAFDSFFFGINLCSNIVSLQIHYHIFLPV